MSPEELREAALRAYDAGALGASVRALSLRSLAPVKVHEQLVHAGFWPQRFAVPGPAVGGARRWRLSPSGTVPVGPANAGLLSEHVYLHADGGAVRLFPETSGIAAFDVVVGPWARKSVLLEKPSSRSSLDLSLEREAFAVSDDGNPLPKSPRREHGLKFDRDDRRASHALARAVVVGARIPLSPAPFANLPLVENGLGLCRTFTILPAGPFWDLAAEIEKAASHGAVLPREEHGDLRLFFCGDAPLAEALRLETPRTGLASLVIHRGSCVLGVDPVGYESSVQALARFTAYLFGREGWRVVEDASGRDLTVLAERRPSLLFGADRPGEVLLEDT